MLIIIFFLGGGERGQWHIDKKPHRTSYTLTSGIHSKICIKMHINEGLKPLGRQVVWGDQGVPGGGGL